MRSHGAKEEMSCMILYLIFNEFAIDSFSSAQ